MSHKAHYGRFLSWLGERLHFAAHSHHPWPDLTRDAHLAAWDDAAALRDDKWKVVFAKVVPEAQRWIAETLRLPDPEAIAFAPNTHEFVARLLSCLPQDRPPRVLTTDSEFHSFARQLARLEEDGAKVERVPVEPFHSFVPRFRAAAGKGGHDLVYFSQCFFNSGLRLSDDGLAELSQAAPSPALVVIDGYHGFMAAPTDLSKACGRAFYLAGGYKYAQAGEGACFMVVPPGSSQRPRDTGWFADFAALEGEIRAPVGYGEGGRRFWGATFDPSGLYRLNAVMRWRAETGLTVEKSDSHARTLQRRFLTKLSERPRGPLSKEALVSADLSQVGHFLTFRVPGAPALCERLARDCRVLADARADRLRFGFGLYQDGADVDELFRRLDALG
ncbi:MAG: aminotransferase class V-fold PLP-dependent enzyme [Elusimicrobiota bacterium]|nr:aminotransferase class V-fold PLP-dependent enzyme [Elusimicrobiota bacterium]